VSTSTDENGKVTSYSYDTTGRVTSITRPDQAKATYGYADSANSVTVSAPIDATNMLKRQSTYDGLGRIRKVTVLDGTNKSYQIVETQYDPVGRAYKVSNPHNSTAQFWTETRYDALGRPTLVIPPDGSSTSNNKKYTYSGNTVIVTDPSGKMTKRQADGLGRATKVFEPDVSNGNTLTQETDLSYSSTDALLQVTQGIQTRNYTYDDLGRVLTAKTPETNQAPISYQYNGFSLVTQRTDARGVVTTYSYDSLNRLSQTSYNVGATGIPATPNVNLTYDEGGAAANSLGRLTTLSDGTGTEKYTYDILGESTQLKKAVNGTQYILGYAYNLAGELTSITYPSGRVVQENYDAIGQLCAVGASGATCTTGTNYASGFAYSPAGEVTGFNYGNGVTASLTYTPDRLALQSLSYAKGTQTLLSWNYWYKTDTTNCPNAPAGNNGQVQCITDNVDSGRSVAYTYDALYRLSTAVTTGSASYPKWGLSWAYDRYGNRNAQSILSGCLAPMTCPTNSVPVDPSTNRLLPPPYAYDANGNMTNDGTNTLAYDAASQLITSTNGGNAAAYVYDGHGIRIRKCAPNCGSPASSTIYIFSGSKVIAEYDNGAAVASPSREYIYSGAQLLAKSESGALTYYHSDHLSNRATTDSSGNVLAQRAHYPFGETWYESGAASKLKFTTYERDSETGNDFAMARYAVSGLGRFSSPDALAGSALAPQSMNRFSYVQNDPINAADPSGLVRTPWGFAFSEVGFGSSWNEFDLLTGAFVLQGVSVNWHIAINPELTAEDTSAWFVIDSIEPVYGGLLMDPGGPGGGAQARIDRARNQARLLLSDPDCADFLKGLIAAISRTSKDGVSLDDFLKGFDSLTIVPTPQGDPQGGGSTIAHVDEVGKDSVIHVDMPFYSGLAPTLLHEDFHTILFGEYDTGLAHNIWKSTGAVGDDPGSFSPDDASIYNHNAFAQHCKTKNK